MTEKGDCADPSAFVRVREGSAALAQNRATAGSQLAASSTEDASPDIAHFIELKNQTAHAIQKAAQQLNTLKEKVWLARGMDRATLHAAPDEASSRRSGGSSPVMWRRFKIHSPSFPQRPLWSNSMLPITRSNPKQ